MAKSKSTKSKSNSLPGSVVTIGLDIGYGVVKAITDSAVVCSVVPGVVFAAVWPVFVFAVSTGRDRADGFCSGVSFAADPQP